MVPLWCDSSMHTMPKIGCTTRLFVKHTLRCCTSVGLKRRDRLVHVLHRLPTLNRGRLCRRARGVFGPDHLKGEQRVALMTRLRDALRHAGYGLSTDARRLLLRPRRAHQRRHREMQEAPPTGTARTPRLRTR